MKLTKMIMAVIMMASFVTVAQAQPKCSHQSKVSLVASTNISRNVRVKSAASTAVEAKAVSGVR